MAAFLPAIAAQGASGGSFFGSAFGALGGLGGLGGGDNGAPPVAISDSDSGPVTVNVGGLNVPAFPNFPLFNNKTTGNTLQPATLSTIDSTYMLAAGAILLLLLIKKK